MAFRPQKLGLALIFIICQWWVANGQSFIKTIPFCRENLMENSFEADCDLGAFTNFRNCYNVTYYGLTIEPNFDQKTINGKVVIGFELLFPSDSLRIDLVRQLQINEVTIDGKNIDDFRRNKHRGVLLSIRYLELGNHQITIGYSGKPIEAVNPPWSGGVVWQTDSLGRPHFGVACQGAGASVWWPCKDTETDLPDSASVTIICSDSLIAVANGKLRKTQRLPDNKMAFTYAVTNPISTYNITANIAKYSTFQDIFNYNGINFPLTYSVLDYNLEKAKMHFRQVTHYLTWLQNKFGGYPFASDGYQLVETPFWGMEHQSCIAYGNDFENLPEGFDFIIVHETAHEYWGNKMHACDKSDLWLHEALATYTETMYLEHLNGIPMATHYLIGQKQRIKNQYPLEKRPYCRHFNPFDTDIYYKGALYLHALRKLVGNDSVWFASLRQLLISPPDSCFTTQKFIKIFNEYDPSGVFFEQMLCKADVPILFAEFKKRTCKFYLENASEKLTLPVTFEVKTKSGIKYLQALATTQPQKVVIPKNSRIINDFAGEIKTVVK